IFQKGYGQDVISDYGTSKSAYLPAKTDNGGSSDTLTFGTGITRINLTWTFNGKDLIFSLTDAPTDKLTIENYYNSFYRVENIQVAGSVLTSAEIMTKQLWQDSAGINSLNWSESAISFNGLAGNDTITSGNFNDQLLGGDDNDSLSSNGGDDTIYGGLGNDTLNAGLGNDFVNGDDGDDLLDGGEGNDSLTGSAGNDHLTGGAGNDSIDGGMGSDRLLESGNFNFTLTNTSLTGNGTDVLSSIETVTLIGSSGNNLLDASSFTLGAVSLDGSTGVDTLIGGTGNDLLKGGSGNDRLTGSAGNDQFIYDTNTAFTTSAVGIDQITDFVSGTDKIVLDKTTFTMLGSVIGSGFNVTTEFAVVNSDAAASTSIALIVYSSGTGNLFYNQNGVTTGLGSGGQFATLSDIPALSATDFILQA
ncbi:MAG: calcium-binding protein, partial [Waterburya sp.]